MNPPRVVRTWLIGMNNPYGPREQYALYPAPVGSAGYRLCTKILGIRHRSLYLECFHRRNTTAGKWNIREARLGAAELVRQIPRDHTIVLLGKQNWDAWESVVGVGYQVIPWKPFTIYSGIDDRKIVLLPHPSGLCRYWNDPGAIDRARQVLKSASPELVGVIP